MEARQTSLEAYKVIRPEISHLQMVVLKAIHDFGPCSDNEIEAITGLKGSTVRPRRIELLRLMMISDAGIAVQKNGRKNTLWRYKKW
jgi:hypothetical protein